MMSWFLAAGIIFSDAIGSALLNMPKAYGSAGGILTSSIVHIVVVLLVCSAYVLFFMSYDKSLTSYEEYVYKTCGSVWQLICSVTISLSAYGANILYLIVIGDQLDRFFTFVVGPQFSEDYWYLDRHFSTTVVSLVIILPLSFSKTIDFLRTPSMIATIASLYTVFFVFVEYFVMKPTNNDVVYRHELESWTDAFRVAPTMIVSYNCLVTTPPAFASLKSRSECIKAAFASVGGLVVCYFIVAIFGYLTFGINVNHDILKSYDPHSPFTLLALLVTTIKTALSYPVCLYVGRSPIHTYMAKMAPDEKPTDIVKEQKHRALIVCTWFFSTLSIAIFVPDLSVAIHYVGCLDTFTVLIFPGLCLFFHIEQLGFAKSWQNMVKIVVAIIYVAVGVFFVGVMFCQSLLFDLFF